MGILALKNGRIKGLDKPRSYLIANLAGHTIHQGLFC